MLLSDLAYGTSAVAALVAGWRVRQGAPVPKAHRYVTGIMIGWTASLVLWAPGTARMMRGIGEQAASWVAGSLAQVAAAGLAGMLSVHLAARPGGRGRRAQRWVAGAAVGVAVALLVLALLPASGLTHGAYTLVWGAAVITGYGSLAWLARISRPPVDPDPLVRVAALVTLAAAGLGVALGVCQVVAGVIRLTGTLPAVEPAVMAWLDARTGLAVAAAALGVLAVTLPSVLPVVTPSWGRLRAQWVTWRLRRQWRDILDLVPHARVPRPPNSDVWERLVGCVVEIRTVQDLLSRDVPDLDTHLDRALAGHRRPRRVPVTLLREAARVRVGMGLYPRDQPVISPAATHPHVVAPPAAPSGILHEARWLRRVGKTAHQVRVNR